MRISCKFIIAAGLSGLLPYLNFFTLIVATNHATENSLVRDFNIIDVTLTINALAKNVSYLSFQTSHKALRCLKAYCFVPLQSTTLLVHDSANFIVRFHKYTYCLR